MHIVSEGDRQTDMKVGAVERHVTCSATFYSVEHSDKSVTQITRSVAANPQNI